MKLSERLILAQAADKLSRANDAVDCKLFDTKVIRSVEELQKLSSAGHYYVTNACIAEFIHRCLRLSVKDEQLQDLFSDLQACRDYLALPWYKRLFRKPPKLQTNDKTTEQSDYSAN